MVDLMQLSTLPNFLQATIFHTVAFNLASDVFVKKAFLRTAHVGEVSVGIWPEAMQEACAEAGIPLL